MTVCDCVCVGSWVRRFFVRRETKDDDNHSSRRRSDVSGGVHETSRSRSFDAVLAS